MACQLWIAYQCGSIRDQLAELKRCARVGYAEGYPDGIMRHSAGGPK